MSNGVDFRKLALDLRAQLTTAQSELAALREELARKDRVIEDLLESNGDMTTCLKSAERHESHCLLLDPEEPDCDCTCTVGRLTTAEQRNAARDIESAAKILANCMDYPWEHMPENGRALMRKHAKDVVDAAMGA